MVEVLGDGRSEWLEDDFGKTEKSFVCCRASAIITTCYRRERLRLKLATDIATETRPGCSCRGSARFLQQQTLRRSWTTRGKFSVPELGPGSNQETLCLVASSEIGLQPGNCMEQDRRQFSVSALSTRGIVGINLPTTGTPALSQLTAAIDHKYHRLTVSGQTRLQKQTNTHIHTNSYIYIRTESLIVYSKLVPIRLSTATTVKLLLMTSALQRRGRRGVEERVGSDGVLPRLQSTQPSLGTVLGKRGHFLLFLGKWTRITEGKTSSFDAADHSQPIQLDQVLCRQWTISDL